MSDPSELEDGVQAPAHYTKVQQPKVVMCYLTGNLASSFKYLIRYPFKGTPRKDLQKSVMFLSFVKDDINRHPELSPSKLLCDEELLPYAIDTLHSEFFSYAEAIGLQGTEADALQTCIMSLMQLLTEARYGDATSVLEGLDSMRNCVESLLTVVET